MNKPFSNALRNIRPDSRANSAEEGTRISGDAPLRDNGVIPGDPGQVAQDLLDETNNGIESLEGVNPTSVSDVAANEVLDGSGSYDTEQDFVDVGLDVDRIEHEEIEGKEVENAPATSTPVAQEAQQERNTDPQSPGDFASRIQDLPDRDLPDGDLPDDRDLPDRQAEGIDNSMATMIVGAEDAPAPVAPPPPVISPRNVPPQAGRHSSNSGEAPRVINEEDLVRASRNRVVIIPRGNNTVIRKTPGFGVSQHAFAEAPPEAPVLHVTAMAVPAAAAPVHQEIAKNPTRNPPVVGREQQIADGARKDEAWQDEAWQDDEEGKWNQEIEMRGASDAAQNAEENWNESEGDWQEEVSTANPTELQPRETLADDSWNDDVADDDWQEEVSTANPTELQPRETLADDSWNDDVADDDWQEEVSTANPTELQPPEPLAEDSWNDDVADDNWQEEFGPANPTELQPSEPLAEDNWNDADGADDGWQEEVDAPELSELPSLERPVQAPELVDTAAGLDDFVSSQPSEASAQSETLIRPVRVRDLETLVPGFQRNAAPAAAARTSVPPLQAPTPHEGTVQESVPVGGPNDKTERQTDRLPNASPFENEMAELLRGEQARTEFESLAESISTRLDPSCGRAIAVSHVDEQAYSDQVVAAVGMTLAKQGYRTLIVDADIRTSGLSTKYGLADNEGFGETCDRYQLWQHLCRSTSVPNLSILPGGTCADRSFLEIDRLRRLFAEFSKGPYSAVLISVGEVSGGCTSALCEVSDDSYVVLRLGRTNRKTATEIIDESGIRFNGCIVTNVGSEA